MPGNEVGDRVHNFFGQENLSQGQHHSQAVHGNWPGLNNNLLVGSQRQISAPFISDLKNYNVQHSGSERGDGSQSSRVPHSFNLAQSNLRPEFGRNPSQNQQPTLNGYVHGQQFFQTRQNEANFLGVDTESDRNNLMSRGMSILGSETGNGPELSRKNLSRMEATESPVDFDFFGGQHQMSGQQRGMLQSLQRQQSAMNDMQLLQQQVMLTQMQEIHRQQQLQQLEARQQSSLNQVSPVPKQTAPNHSAALINGIPINEASNYPWPPELAAGNANWLQRGASPVVQGSSSGLVLSPEQGQALCLMGMVPQQVDQSLSGVPISNARSTPNQSPHVQMDKPALQQVSAGVNSFSVHQYATFPGQVSMQDESLASRQDFQAKNSFGPAAGQGLNSGFNMETLQQVNPQRRSASIQEFNGRQELAGSSETSQEKTLMQVAPPQNVSSLDPTEEKILFGSDDNLWDAFGKGTGGFNMSDGIDFLNGCPSLQSGSWSALMQSAVAETSSAETGMQEEWSGPTFGNSGPLTGNQQPLTINDGGKQQVWTDNNLQTASNLNSRSFSRPDDANRPTTSTNYFNAQGFQQSGKMSHQQGDILQGSSERSIPQFHEGSKWSDRSPLQKPLVEGSHIYGNAAQSLTAETNTKSISGAWAHQQSISSYNSGGQPYNRSNGWNFMESVSPDGAATPKHQENEKSSQLSQVSDHKGNTYGETGHSASRWKNASVPHLSAVSNSNTSRGNQERSQQLNNSNMDLWRDVDSSGNSKGKEVMGKYQRHPNESSQVKSSGNNGLDRAAVEMHETENSNKKENSGDSFQPNMSQQTPTGGLGENIWLDASTGGKQKLSSLINRKPGTRRFQYHPMGDVDVDVDPSYGVKHIANSQSRGQQVTQGSRGHEQMYIGQSRFAGQTNRNSMELEKGDTKGFDEIPLKSNQQGFVPHSSSPFDKSLGAYDPNKTATSSQNMLELLHKVDQSNELGAGTRISSSNCYLSSETREMETSDGSGGHLQGRQSSATQGFGLQLAPPSQRLLIPDRALSSQSSSQTVLGSSRVASGTADKGSTWLASTSSVQSLSSSHESSQGELRNDISASSGQPSNIASQYSVPGNFSAAFTSGSPFSRSHLQPQPMAVASGQRVSNQSVDISFDRLPSHSKQIDQSGERASMAQAVLAGVPDMSASIRPNNLTCSVEMSHSRDPAQQIPFSETIPVSLPCVTPGMSQPSAFSKTPPNLWNNVSGQQSLSGPQLSNVPSHLLKSHLQPDHSSGPLTVDNQDPQRGGNGQPGFVASSVNSPGFVGKEHFAKESPGQQVSAENIDCVEKTLNASQGKESIVKRLSDSTHSNAAANQKVIEAFGRSLRPNNVMHQNYSLLNQMQAMKSEIDPSNRSVKRFRGPDSGVEVQQVAAKGGQQVSYGYNAMVREASVDHSSVPSGDSKMLSFSAKLGENRDTNVSSQDMLAFGQDNTHHLSSSNSPPAVRAEHSQISPQMAPSWFERYGNLKNGQMLPSYDAGKTAAGKAFEQPFIVGKPSDELLAHNSGEQVNAVASASHLANVKQGFTSTAGTNEQLSTPHLLPSDVNDQSLVVVRPKKRKSGTLGLTSWHKEVMEGFQRLQSISESELAWAQAANRLIEKVDDEAEVFEDGFLMLRPKRRLILSTQLMQQLLCPPPAVILSADSSLHYESVAYFVARLALGDACSAIACSGNDTLMPPDGRNLRSEKLRTSGRSDEQCLKVIEDFIRRARKLENDLLRLENRVPILDLRVECQDLEKFSVINRFAKFHGRGQVDGTEPSSSSEMAANTQKSFPQRYVTALPMPRNLPDRVQCLSL